MLGGMRTSKDGPVVASERTLRALFAIRRAVLLPKLYGTVVVGRSSYEAILATGPPEMADWPWLAIEQDRPEVELPARIAGAPAPDAAALRLALALNASLVLLDWLTAGRIACGERWTMRRYRCQNDVYIDGHHVYADATLLTKTFGPIDAMFRVGPYNCLATMVVVGNRLEGITRQFVDAVEARPLGNRLPMISSVSTFDRGAVVRVASTSTSAVTGFLRDRIRQLAGVLGEDPWARKW